MPAGSPSQETFSLLLKLSPELIFCDIERNTFDVEVRACGYLHLSWLHDLSSFLLNFLIFMADCFIFLLLVVFFVLSIDFVLIDLVKFDDNSSFWDNRILLLWNVFLFLNDISLQFNHIQNQFIFCNLLNFVMYIFYIFLCRPNTFVDNIFKNILNKCIDYRWGILTG